MLIQIFNGFNREVFPGKGVVVPWPVDVVIQRCIKNPQRRVSFTDEDVLQTFGQESAESVRAMSKVKRRSEVVDRKLRSWLSHEISRFNDKLLEKGLDVPLILGDGVKGRTAKRLSISDIETPPG
jgi:hypothetical protein